MTTLHREEVMFPRLDREVTWTEEDEDRFAAALLAAGAEPSCEESDAHTVWQMRAAEVLMQMYTNHWWMKPQASPEYRKRAQTVKSNVQRDELTKFYTWVCKQRREPWTDRIDQPTR